VKHRLLTTIAAALAVAAAAPITNAARSYEGYKSSYPQLHQLHQLGSNSVSPYDGYKSSYPQLHRLHQPGSNRVSPYEGYKSSYPQLHQLRSNSAAKAPLVRIAGRGFDWRDASIGAGTAAGLIFLLAAGTLVLTRRRAKLAL